MSTKHDELVNKFRKMLEENPITLDLKLNGIEDEGVKALAAVLPNNSLTMLDLKLNDIGDEGAKVLATALSQSSLTTLNLNFNRIKDEGAKALAKALFNSPLTTLNLNNNRIGTEGTKALATALSQSSLTTLNLRFNGIGDEEAKALATALPQSSLTTLNLWSNDIGDEGAKALAAALPTSSLTTLNLRFNDIEDEGKKSLKEATLKSGCCIYRTGIDEIDEALKPKKEKFLAAANRFLPGKYIDKEPFNQSSDDEKIALLFEKLDAIKCRNQFMQHFMSKNGDCTKKMGLLMPIKELSQHIISFVYPELSSQDIAEAWTMAEDKLLEITKKNNTIYEAIDTIQPTRMTG